jgi:hypothetical protein
MYKSPNPTPMCPNCKIEMALGGACWISEYDPETNVRSDEKGYAAARYICPRCGLTHLYAFHPSELPSLKIDPSGLLPMQP